MSGYVLQAVPALIGAFVGAPVLARELETGTFRYAWTQGFGRWRWTLAKLVLLAVVVTAAAGAFSVLFSWYYQPFFADGQRRSRSPPSCSTCAGSRSPPGRWPPSRSAPWPACSSAGSSPRSSPPWPPTPGSPSWPALFLRQHYLTPLVTSNLNLPGSAWIMSQWWTKGGSVRVRPAVPSADLLQQFCPPSAVGPGKPSPGDHRAVPLPARLHAVDQLPAGQPVLAVPVDRGRLAARAVGAAHRRDRLAGPPPRGLRARRARNLQGVQRRRRGSRRRS